MSGSPIEAITTFLRSWNNGIDAIHQSLNDYLTPHCVWENVGMTRTVGPQAADECFFSFAPTQDCSRIDVRILAISAQGDTVLTERDERVIGKDGRETLAVRSMGVFVVKNGTSPRARSSCSGKGNTRRRSPKTTAHSMAAGASANSLARSSTRT